MVNFTCNKTLFDGSFDLETLALVAVQAINITGDELQTWNRTFFTRRNKSDIIHSSQFVFFFCQILSHHENLQLNVNVLLTFSKSIYY